MRSLPQLGLTLVLIFSTTVGFTAVKDWYQDPTITMRRDMSVGARGFRQFVNSSRFNAENCSQSLNDVYQSLYALDPDYFLGKDVRDGNIEAMKIPGNNNPLQNFFLARLAIRQKFAQWVKDGEFSKYEEMQQCGRALKVTIRSLRTFEDFYGQVLLQDQGFFDKPEEEQKTHKFQGGWPHSMVNPKYAEGHYFPQSKGDKHGSLQNGDILLSRGTAFTSAVISRIGSVDNQFSHLAIVYEADGSIKKFFNREKQWEDFIPGNLYVLEAVLDNGFQVVTLDEYIGIDKARLAHYRYVGNGKFSEEELKEIRSMAAKKLAVLAAENKVPYNFSMNMKSNETLFCSQAVSYGYQMACEELGKDCEMTPLASAEKRGHAYPFPILATEIPKQEGSDSYVNQLADMLQLNVTQVFAPADVDSSPQIEMVGEWRQYKHIGGRRIHDMIFTKMFQWIEQDGYKLKSSQQSPVIGDLSFVGQMLASELEKMPPNTPDAFVEGTMLMAYMVESPGLNAIGKKIVNGLLATDTAKELLAALDDVEKMKAFLKLTKLGVKSASKVESGLGALTAVTDILSSDLVDSAIDTMDEDEVEKRMKYLKELVESGRLVDMFGFVGLYKEMEKFRNKHIEEMGYPPTDFAYDQYLERVIKVGSCKKYIEDPSRVAFHYMFAKDFTDAARSDRSLSCSTELLDWRVQW